jgi:hypothetical protein
MSRAGVNAGSAYLKPMQEPPEITIINKLSYLMKIAPSVDIIASRNAAKDITIKAERMLAKAVGS